VQIQVRHKSNHYLHESQLQMVEPNANERKDIRFALGSSKVYLGFALQFGIKTHIMI